MLELVVIVDAVEDIEVDGGGGGDDHVETITAEVAVTCVLYDLWKYDFFEADSAIDYDRLTDQYDEVAVRTGG